MLVDNDVNIMALGEHWARWRDADHLLFVKVGTGIGCGIIAGGRIHRGAQGAAGDIGHIHVPRPRRRRLPLRQHRLPGGDRRRRRHGRLADAPGDRGARRPRRRRATCAPAAPTASALVRQAGRELGGVLATIVNFFNPAVIVIGGDIAHADEHLLAGVREVVYQRSLPLATRSLRIVRSRLDDRAGVIGAAVMVDRARPRPGRGGRRP